MGYVNGVGVVGNGVADGKGNGNGFAVDAVNAVAVNGIADVGTNGLAVADVTVDGGGSGRGGVEATGADADTVLLPTVPTAFAVAVVTGAFLAIAAATAAGVVATGATGAGTRGGAFGSCCFCSNGTIAFSGALTAGTTVEVAADPVPVAGIAADTLGGMIVVDTSAGTRATTADATAAMIFPDAIPATVAVSVTVAAV